MFDQFFRALAASCLVLTALGCESAPDAGVAQAESKSDEPVNKAALSTDMARGSYLVGYDQARQLMTQTYGVIDAEAYLAGVEDSIAGADSQVPEAQAQSAMTALRDAVVGKQEEAQAAQTQKADAYRQAFAQEEGVTTTDSGLMYKVLVAGDGAKPALTDTVTTHYEGTLIDGTVFDSSVQRGQPASFRVDGVIKGWTEALQQMPVGSKWKLVIPPDLAYGSRGAGPQIGPNETLVFEVELLSIQAAQ